MRPKVRRLKTLGVGSGANMVEFRTSSGEYCVCGSQLNRRRMGYGQKPRSARGSVSCPVYVLIPEGCAREVDTELRRLWKQCTRHEDHATVPSDVGAVEANIANISPWREKTDSRIHRAASTRPREPITEPDALRADLDVSKPPRT